MAARSRPSREFFPRVVRGVYRCANRLPPTLREKRAKDGGTPRGGADGWATRLPALKMEEGFSSWTRPALAVHARQIPTFVTAPSID